MNRIIANYTAQCSPTEAAGLARAIAWEQTVEVVESVVKSERILQTIVGRVEDIQQQGRSAQITISYNPELASGQINQLFNLTYGNVSMYPGVKLSGLQIPDPLTETIGGPRYGVTGVRRRLGVFDRPLLSTAIKPRGSRHDEFARLAYQFGKGGGDIIKDDQNLVDADFEAFKTRVDIIMQAVERAQDETGRACLYLPMAGGIGTELEQQLEFVHRRGIPGVLMCPLVAGLGTCKDAAQRYDLIYMAHPAMSGVFTVPETQGIAAAVLQGTLLRLGGADISVFAGAGGRLSNSPETCRAIIDALLEPLGTTDSTLPCPAGGKTLPLLRTMLPDYPVDTVFLIGGALLSHSDDLTESTREYMSLIQEHYPERRETPLTGPQTACEMPSADAKSEKEFLRHTNDFHWQQRSRTDYKHAGELPFLGVSRTELIGQNGEQTQFDLRYFELEVDGYTSLEKHLHTHVIIAVRGRGILLQNDSEIELGFMDIAYIKPLAKHQLRNPHTEPFGFFCLVDHERDRPMRP